MLAKPERKDAVRSRSTLLVAARRVFSEHGALAPLELVIEAAGVGRGTLYRHFPDRISLIVALFGAEIDTLSVVMASAEPEQRIEVLLGHIARTSGDAHLLVETWRSVPAAHPEMRQCRDRFLALLDAPLKAAIEAGVMRPDLTAGDLLLAAAMISAAARLAGTDLNLRLVAYDILLQGLAPKVTA